MIIQNTNTNSHTLSKRKHIKHSKTFIKTKKNNHKISLKYLKQNNKNNKNIQNHLLLFHNLPINL